MTIKSLKGPQKILFVKETCLLIVFVLKNAVPSTPKPKSLPSNKIPTNTFPNFINFWHRKIKISVQSDPFSEIPSSPFTNFSTLSSTKRKINSKSPFFLMLSRIGKIVLKKL